MKTFWIRTASALFFAVFMVGGIFWNHYSFFVLMSVILLGSVYEYFTISNSEKESAGSMVMLLIMFLFFYTVSFFIPQVPVSVLVGVFAFKLFSRSLFLKTSHPFLKTQQEMIPVFWILLPLLLTNQIFSEKGAPFLFSIFALIWIYDTGCYLVGSLIGKHKLLERISPKKTIEGAIGGAVVTILTAAFFNRIPQLSELSSPQWIALGALIVITATIGDLVESVFKRGYKVKDSGTIMPGHGGFLDRFDAFFFTVPFVSLALWLFEQLHLSGIF